MRSQKTYASPQSNIDERVTAVEPYRGGLADGGQVTNLHAVPVATDWTLPSGLRSTDLSPGNLGAFPADVGQARNVFHSLQRDLFVMEAENHFRTPVTVGARVLFDEPILALRLPSGGRAAIRHAAYGRIEESDECWNIGLVTDSTCSIEHHPGEAYRSLVAVLTIGRLRTLLDRQRCPATVDRFLAGRVEGAGFSARTNSRLRRVAGEISRNPYRGAMASLYAEGKLFELLAETFTILGAQEERQVGIDGRDRKAAMAAYDMIRENIAAPLQVEEVARLVGLSQRRLCDLFHELFGASPFQCLTRWRLEKARDLIDQGDLSVKQIAYSMGYAHVSSFSQAYTRQFGHPPTAWRRVNNRGS